MDKSMIEFLNKERIKERMDDVSNRFFEFEITDEAMREDIQNDINQLLTTLSNELAQRGELDETWPMAISYLLDTVMAQLIVVKMQNKFIENVNKGDDDDADNG